MAKQATGALLFAQNGRLTEYFHDLISKKRNRCVFLKEFCDLMQNFPA